MVGEQQRVLIEAKSPSVMSQLDLPDQGFTFTWPGNRSDSLAQRVLTKVSVLSVVLMLF
jgi:hypothetical protein